MNSANAEQQPFTSPWLTSAEAARYLRIGRSTLEGYRTRGGGPTYHRQGGKLVFYHRAELDAWRRTGCAAHTAQERLTGQLVN